MPHKGGGRLYQRAGRGAPTVLLRIHGARRRSVATLRRKVGQEQLLPAALLCGRAAEEIAAAGDEEGGAAAAAVVPATTAASHMTVDDGVSLSEQLILTTTYYLKLTTCMPSLLEHRFRAAPQRRTALMATATRLHLMYGASPRWKQAPCMVTKCRDCIIQERRRLAARIANAKRA